MIEIIHLLFPAIFACYIFSLLKKEEFSMNTLLFGRFAWFTLSINTVFFFIVQYLAGNASSLVGPSLYVVTFTWKALCLSLALAVIMAILTYVITTNIDFSITKEETK